MQNELMSPKEKTARIIAIVIFSLVMAALLTAIITDAAIFSQQIVGFFVAVFGSAIVFLFACILMVISCVLIFGVYVLKTEGFWPTKWASEAFHGVLNDIKVTESQVSTLITVRVVLIVVCLIIFVSAIVALSLAKSAKKENPKRKQKLTKAFGIVSLILSILGLFAAGVLILILSTIV